MWILLNKRAALSRSRRQTREPANAVTARAARTQTRAKSDEEAGNRELRPGHIDIRRRRNKKKFQRGRRGEQSEQEGRAPTEFAITRGERAVDDPADPQGAADKQEEQRGGESKRDAAGEGGPGREMRPVDLHIGSTSFSQAAT